MNVRLPRPNLKFTNPSAGMVNPISTGLRSGSIYGARGIKTKINQVYEYVVEKWVKTMLTWSNTNVPKRTGNLLRQVRSTIESSSWNSLNMGAPGVPYARYVNEMNPPVNWTNPPRAYHFYDKLTAIGLRIVRPIIKQAIIATGLDVFTGIPADQLVGVFSP